MPFGRFWRKGRETMYEAMLYRKLDNGKVQCDLCAHRCKIRPGLKGICAVRENRDGTLHTLVFGMVIAVHVDPIEKKPLFHYLPGTRSLSIATAGCNFRCDFCQNWQISQISKGSSGQVTGQYFPPEEVVAEALRTDSATIAYTYTEPTIFFEYAYETAKLAHEEGIKNVFVTNGYQTAEAIEMMAGVIDAANVDLKSFSDRYYRKLCGARLQPVLEAIKLMHQKGILVEVTTLVVPGQNDSPDELAQIAEFLVGVSPDLPWHISAFHPNYKMLDTPATSMGILNRACQIGLEAGLNYVYVGNVPGNRYESTYCPQCGETVIGRWGYHTTIYLEGDQCQKCGAKLPIVRG
ncbi:MAG: AmmeMemoRadiSam system radical SAM enzyme [Anaerolineae bacterium]